MALWEYSVVEGHRYKIVSNGISFVILKSLGVNCNVLMDIIAICRSSNIFLIWLRKLRNILKEFQDKSITFKKLLMNPTAKD